MYPVLPASKKVEVLVTEHSGPYYRYICGDIKKAHLQPDRKGLKMGVLYDNAEGFGRAGYSDYVVKWYGEPKDAEKEVKEIR